MIAKFEEEYMMPHVSNVFQSFIATFFSIVHQHLIEEMHDTRFEDAYITLQLNSLTTIDEIITTYNVPTQLNDLANGEVLSRSIDAYIEIAECCANFQLEATDLLHQYFPQKYPNYFLSVEPQLKALQQQLVSIQREKQAVETNYSEVCVQLDHAQNLAIEERAEFEKTVTEKITQLQQLTAQLTKFEKSLTEQKITYTQLQCDYDELKQTEQALQQSLEENNVKLADAEQQNHTLQTTVAELTDTIDSNTKEYQRLTKDYDVILQERSELQASYMEHRNELQVLREQYERAQQEKKMFVQQQENQQQQASMLEQRLSDLQQKTSNVLTENEQLQHNTEIQEENSIKMRKLLKKQWEELETLKQERENAIQASRVSEIEFEKLQQQLTHATEEMKQLNEKVAWAQTANEMRTQENATLLMQKQQLEKKITDFKQSTPNSRESSTQQFTEQQKEQQRSMDLLIEHRNWLENELAEYKQKEQQANQKLHGAELLIQSLQQQQMSNEVEEHLHKLQASLEKEVLKNTDLEQKIASMEGNIAFWKGQYKEVVDLAKNHTSSNTSENLIEKIRTKAKEETQLLKQALQRSGQKERELKQQVKDLQDEINKE